MNMQGSWKGQAFQFVLDVAKKKTIGGARSGE
jgi:hypothetical protein